MIRITLAREAWVGWNDKQVQPCTIVREFDDPVHAADWFINDSYFGEEYTRHATWERIDDA